MSKSVYQKACDLICKELSPIKRRDDIEKTISVFEVLIKDGNFAADDEIYRYIMSHATKSEKDTRHSFALKVQTIYEVVKVNLQRTPRNHWNREWIRARLYN